MSGLAPGKLAATEIVGKSTCGSGETGSTTKPIAPASATAAVSSVVAMGRAMNALEGFMPGSDSVPADRARARDGARSVCRGCQRKCI